MESENRVTVEEERIVSERTDLKESATEAKKEEQIADINGEGASKSQVKATKISKPLKDPGSFTSGTSKNSKATKEKSNPRSSVPISRNQKPVMTQSLSIPARRVHVDGLVKSIDRYPTKNGPKHAQEKSTKAQATSLSGLNPKTHASSNPDSKQAAVTTKSVNLASLPSNKQAVAAKSDPGNVAAKSHSSLESADSKAITVAQSIKEDDDAHSTTSSTRRNSGPGFTSRLEERAEKRKQFFSKLEEKIQAKEAEKNNLEEKSKEKHEAEIKQLRKSLAFKAAPMPSFYKEPPPKVELKKIPTTRAKSPKLGRHKSNNIAATNNPSAGDGSSVTLSLNHEHIGPNKTERAHTNGNEDNVSSKRDVKKSQPKLRKIEPKTRKVEKNIVKDVAGEINPDQNGGPVLSLANTETMPHRVTVGG